MISDQTHLQPRLNRANELISSSISPLVDQWRHVLHYCFTVLSPSDESLLTIFIRLSEERGFTIPSTAESLSVKEFISSICKAENMDLRWIPGWNCIINPDSPDVLSAWNSRIVNAFLSALRSLHKSILSFSSSLTFNDQIPVICALDHCVKGDIPIAFSEAYPGLQTIESDISTALNDFEKVYSNRAHGRLDFNDFLAALAKLTAWFQQFGSQPIGSPSDWSERQKFFSRYCRSPQSGVAAVAKLMELVHRYLQAPIPKSLTEPKRLDLCHFPWAKMALEAQDQISIRLNPMDTDERGTNEIPDLPSSETSESIRLWPVLVAGLVFGRFHEPFFIEYSDNLSRNLLLELSIQLGALSRPRLLEMFASSTKKASSNSMEILLLGSRAVSPLDLVDPCGLVKPDLVHEWQSLSQAVFAVNHANFANSRNDGLNCSFAEWISHQRTLSDLFQLLHLLAPLSTHRQRIDHKIER